MRSNTASSSSSSSSSKSKASSQVRKVRCVMDYENCDLPPTREIPKLKSKIEAALKTSDPRFEIHEKIFAVGPNNGPSYHKLMSRPEDFEVFTIPQIYMGCDSDTDCNKFVVHGHPTDQTEKVIRKTDIADMFLVQRMYMDAFEVSAILIISSDSDFVDSIVGIKDLSLQVLLAVEDKVQTSATMFCRASFTWYWKSNTIGKESMIDGGQHLGHGYRRPRPAPAP